MELAFRVRDSTVVVERKTPEAGHPIAVLGGDEASSSVVSTLMNSKGFKELAATDQ